MAYPNAGPNSYLALVAVYKLLVMNNIITDVYTCIYNVQCTLLRSLNGYPAGNARDRRIFTLVTVTELSVSSGEVHVVLAKSSSYVCKSC